MLKDKNIFKSQINNIDNSYYFFYFIPEVNAFGDW
jgi:hypothetical protein